MRIIKNSKECEEPPGRTQRQRDGEKDSLPVSPNAELFRRVFFLGIRREQWNDWKWQLAQRVSGHEELGNIMQLTEKEAGAIKNNGNSLPFAVTPYYLSVIDHEDPESPLRRSVIPRTEEMIRGPGDSVDPLSEHEDTVAPGLVHRYPDRVLFLATGFCSTNCRYCTRSRLVGKNHHAGTIHHRWSEAIGYIARHREVRDVLISGGDPLTLEDRHLEGLLRDLRKIPHVEIIRIGTKVPAVMPMRITKDLTDTLKKYHPLFMSLHFIHPREITPETSEACARLADAGIPLGSQTVLLKGINDDAEVLTRLFQGLLRIRVKPYYLYQCDPVAGTSHFRTPVEKGIELLEKVRGFTSGYAVPAYVVDAPGGGGKIQLLADHIEGRQGGELLLINYEGKEFRYPDPGGSVTSCRLTSEKS